MTKKSIRKAFSRIGFSFVSILVFGSILQITAAEAIKLSPKIYDWFLKSSLGMMLISFVPLYVFAFPLGFLILRKLPSWKKEKEKMAGRELLSFGIMCLPIMYLGNTIGTLLSGILSGGTATNTIEELLTGNILVEILFLVILAPLFEELLFRKFLIDKTVCFGEKTAVIFSALTFGLFHGNLFQFFYTFGIGFIWAYIYVKTRKFSYVFCLHAVFNFIGGIVPSMLLKYVGAENIAALETMDINTMLQDKSGIALYGIYTMVLIILAAAGAVLLIRRRKEFVFEPVNQSEVGEENNAAIKITPAMVWLNPGMLLFSLLILYTFIVMLLA